MVIALNSDQEQVIDQAIQAGLIRDAEDVIEIGVGTIRQRLQAVSSAANTLSAEEWSRRLHAWADSHPTDTPLLSDEAISRESIYGDRGL
jgi:hypothetical protein